ncbi:hypothetical protein CsatB_025190 [Cannabis sativa]
MSSSNSINHKVIALVLLIFLVVFSATKQNNYIIPAAAAGRALRESKNRPPSPNPTIPNTHNNFSAANHH